MKYFLLALMFFSYQNVYSLDISADKIIDLSHVYDENTIYWPNSPIDFELKVQNKGFVKKGYFYSANSFCTPEHGGTHLDAPVHFYEKGKSTDEISLKKLVSKVYVIDVSARSRVNRDYRLEVRDVLNFEKKSGKIEPNSVVLMRTDWSEYWPNKKNYLGDDRPGRVDDLHFPSFGLEAVKYLVEKRSISAIGIDTASIDYGLSSQFHVHRFVGKHDIYGLENLTNLKKLPPVGATIIALPMKIKGGSGGPARVIAILP